MRKEWLWALALALLLSSAALGWMAWERGEIDLYLILFFPVLKAEGAYGAAAMFLAVASLMVVVLSFWVGIGKDGLEPKGRTSVGGLIMLGPIPIVIGSDRRTTLITIVLALIVLMIMALLLVQ